ncbi:polyprenyl diphosphate synthase [Streptomyces sp. NRRL S-340]|uniref:polyprenyl diphosphate synthase n=1 Tax=Streptomyces sp. NRRL S-340 TaxID=1463901 RepID=UPI00099DEF03|nr:polyprenyl diphosphate synthase [Streptomyces sp. NRRL S-340]
MTPGASVRHLACIMDGNGRWAQNRGLDRTHGHMAAHHAFDAIVDGALGEGVEWLTLFAFSTENWARPEEEVTFLVHFLAERVIKRSVSRMHQRGVRLRLLGWEDPRIPVDVMDRLREAEELTRRNTTLHLTLAFNYGGRRDLCETARSLVSQGVTPERISPDTFARHMALPELPDVDLLLRTGGEHRISNFLLWHCAYAELVFLDVLWPDFRAPHFQHALELYRQRQRRFGAVGPATAPGPDHPADDGTAWPGADGRTVLPAVAAQPGRTGRAGLLGLPTTIASHLGASLLNGLKETARFALLQFSDDHGQTHGPEPW